MAIPLCFFYRWTGITGSINFIPSPLRIHNRLYIHSIHYPKKKFPLCLRVCNFAMLMGSLNCSYLSEKKMGSLSVDWSGFLVLAEVCCQEEERLMGMKLLAQRDSVWGSIPKRKRSCSSVGDQKPSLMINPTTTPAKIASGFPVLESRVLNLISSSGFADKDSDVIASGFCEKGSRIVGNEGLKRESCVDWVLLPGLVDQESKRLEIVVSGSLEQHSRKNHNGGLKRKSCVRGPDDDKDRAKRKKRKYGTRVKGLCHAPPASLPEKYMTMVNGAEVKLVIQKQLYATDVKRHQGRLTLPPGKLVCKDFLRANEMEILNQGSLTVPMIDPKLDKEEISLCLWKLTDSDERKSLVLKTTWNKIVEKNNLIEGDLIQIWSSRDSNDLLQLALVVVKKAERGKSGEEAGSSSATITVSNGFECIESRSHTGSTCQTVKVIGSSAESISTSSELLCK